MSQANNMSLTDDRTDVLKALVSKPLHAAELPTVTREMASLVITIYSEFFELTRIVKGNNGSGLVAKMQSVETNVKDILEMVKQADTDAKTAKAAATEATTNSPFTRGLKWFADKVLPSLLSWIIIGAIGFTVAVALHIQLVKTVP